MGSHNFKSTVQFASAHPAHFWRITINLSASEAGLFFCNLSKHLEYIAFIMKGTSISQMPHHYKVYFCLKIVLSKIVPIPNSSMHMDLPTKTKLSVCEHKLQISSTSDAYAHVSITNRFSGDQCLETTFMISIRQK